MSSLYRTPRNDQSVVTYVGSSVVFAGLLVGVVSAFSLTLDEVIVAAAGLWLFELFFVGPLPCSRCSSLGAVIDSGVLGW